MTVEEWIQDNYDNVKKWLFNVTKGDRPDLYDDFIHEVLLIFLEHPKAYEVVLNGDARFFLTRIALNQWRSSTSPFHRVYRPPHNELLIDLPIEDEDYDYDIDIIQDLLVQILDEMHLGSLEEYYMSLVIMIYHTLNNNFSEMQRQLGIPRTSLSKVCNKGIDLVKERLDEKIQLINNGTINVNRDRTLIYDRWSKLLYRSKRKANANWDEAAKGGILGADGM